MEGGIIMLSEQEIMNNAFKEMLHNEQVLANKFEELRREITEPNTLHSLEMNICRILPKFNKRFSN